MINNTWYLKTKWFNEVDTPVNPKAATGTLTFSGIPVVTETIVIGTETYELCTATATEGNIAVVIGSTVTADNAVSKLSEAINAHSSLVTAAANTTADTVVVTYKSVGTAGNEIATTETCTNAAWGDEKLSEGQYGTPCPEVNSLVYASPYYYWCDVAGNRDDVSWKRFTPASY